MLTPPPGFLSSRHLAWVFVVLVAAVPLDSSGAPGEVLSDQSLILQIDGNLDEAVLAAANVWEEPYVQPRYPREEGESVLGLFDDGGNLILEIPLPLIEMAPIPILNGSVPRADASFSQIIAVPDLPEISSATLRFREIEPESLAHFQRVIDVDLGDLRNRLGEQFPAELTRNEISVRFAAPETYDFVLVAEGYTENERGLFEDVATTYINELLSREPWNEYADRLNFRTVFRPSQDSGVSTEEDPKDTAYGLLYAGTIRKCPVNIRAQLPAILADARWAAADFVAILVNESPGSPAGVIPGCTDMRQWLAVTGANTAYVSWFKHEMEHWGELGEEGGGFPGDGDEEGSECQYDASAGFWNLTGDPECGKWEEWLGTEGVGCYPGGLGCHDNIFHPGETCAMSEQYWWNMDVPLCPVCREATAAKILNWSQAVRPLSSTSARVRPGISVWLSILNKTRNGEITWWRKAGTAWQPIQYGGDSYRFQSLATGIHEIKVTVVDPTPWIRKPLFINTFSQGGWGVTTGEASFRITVAP